MCEIRKIGGNFGSNSLYGALWGLVVSCNRIMQQDAKEFRRCKTNTNSDYTHHDQWAPRRQRRPNPSPL